jgi:hypothetical protein
MDANTTRSVYLCGTSYYFAPQEPQIQAGCHDDDLSGRQRTKLSNLGDSIIDSLSVNEAHLFI